MSPQGSVPTLQAPLMKVPLPHMGQVPALEPEQQTVRPQMTPRGPWFPLTQLEAAPPPFVHPLGEDPWAVHPVEQVVAAVQPVLQVAVRAWGPVLQLKPTPRGSGTDAARRTTTGGS